MVEKLAESYPHLTSMTAPLLKTEFSDKEDEVADGIRLNKVSDSGNTGRELHDSNNTLYKSNRIQC